MKTLIVTGGAIDDAFARNMIEKEKYSLCIAADSGMDFYYRTGISPDIVIGDFDSADAEALLMFESDPSVEIVRLNPIKDDTDTEAAINLAIERGASQITLLGATGSRIDHILSNIALLGIGLRQGVPICIADPYNRIRMTDHNISIRKDEQFGRFVSLLPYAGEVRHITLTGFKYGLCDATLSPFSSLGISNEIAADTAHIEFPEGILLVIESLDPTL